MLRHLIPRWLRAKRPSPTPVTDDLAQARQLIAAIDRGGLPLNPAKVNAIAQGLGLEVHRHAPVEDTLARIRACLARA